MIRRIVLIVEGHSEAQAIPAFVRRILRDRGAFAVEPDSFVIREHRQKLTDTEILGKRLKMAAQRAGCAGALVLMDADDDAALQARAPSSGGCARAGVSIPYRVVLAVREIESWVLAGIESLRGVRGVKADARSPENVESIRGAKKRPGDLMTNGYKPTIDLPPMLQRLDYQGARTSAASLDKFLRDLDALVEDTRR